MARSHSSEKGYVTLRRAIHTLFTFYDAGPETSSTAMSGNTTRKHRLMFNITSVGRDEDIYLAELRLLTLVETDRSLYDGVHRRVTVYELHASSGNSTASETAGYHQIASKVIYGRSNDWETFTVTEAVKRLVRQRVTAQVSQLDLLNLLSLLSYLCAWTTSALMCLVCPVIRPPVRSNGRTYKMLVMFFFFRQVPSAVPRPIAVKLCHMIGNWFD